MKDFIISIITTVIAVLLSTAIFYGILSIFIKSAKPKIITIGIYLLILLYMLIFEMDELNTFGTIIGIIISGFIGYKLLVGKGDSENNES